MRSEMFHNQKRSAIRVGLALGVAGSCLLGVSEVIGQDWRDSGKRREPQQERNQHHLSDQEITRNIQRELASEAGLQDQVEVQTRNKEVTLTGRVDTLLQRQRAVDIANSLPEVSSVYNRLQVTAPQRPDNAIRRDVQNELTENVVTQEDSISVQVHQGVATLRGTVESWQEKQYATRIAQSVLGVRGVRNELDVQRAASRSDRDIARDIQSRLDADAAVDDHNIHLRVIDGRVFLEGTVSTLMEKAQAISDAMVMNVSSVDASGLRVQKLEASRFTSQGGRNRSEQNAQRPSDQQIGRRILRRVQEDTSINPAYVSVEVSNGRVTLSGHVRTEEQKADLAAVAWTAAGIEAVDHSGLRVDPGIISQAEERVAGEDRNGMGGTRDVGAIESRGRSFDIAQVDRYNDLQRQVDPNDQFTDSQITRQLQRSFIYDEKVPSHHVEVETRDGVVTLTGSVNNLLAHERAEEHAYSVPNVRRVENRIRVKAPDRDDAEIRGDVRRKLASDPAADASEVNVPVINGKVILTGTADSWAERRLSEQVAKGVPGVTEVENGISINARRSRPDREIAAEVRRQLESDVWLGESPIQVEVNNGTVSLSGTVENMFQKGQAYTDAWVSGVTFVDTSGLKVEAEGNNMVPSAFGRSQRDPVEQGHQGSGRTQQNQSQSDLVSERGIRAALERSPYLEGNEVDVTVKNGTARLSGQVDSTFERLEAEAIASDFSRVESVQNDLRVSLDVTGYRTWNFYEYDGDHDLIDRDHRGGDRD